MYAIISGGLLVALCDKPRYIKVNTKTGAYIEAAEKDAIGISVGGNLFNLPGRTAIEGAPEAIIKTDEVSEYVFRNSVKISENEKAAAAGFTEVEDAICEFDAANEDRIGAIENALCELDEALYGGGETDE